MTTETLASLKANLDKLNPRDRSDAQSLLDSHARWGRLTPRQQVLFELLARRAVNGGSDPGRARVSIGGLDAINALFDRARAKLKQPSIVMSDSDGIHLYRLKVAGPTARVPGSINVVGANGAASGNWYGRILGDGAFEITPRVPIPPGLVSALTAFARDPAGMAGANGKATGRCCFCGLAIGEGDDPRARSVGYGEVCAGHWGLPFPGKAQANTVNAAMFQALPTPAPAPPPVPAPSARLLAALETPGAARRPAGVCAKCEAAGWEWEEPMFDGTCYQCGGAL